MTTATEDREHDRELGELERLIAERGQQRPAPVPEALHKIADRGAG